MKTLSSLGMLSILAICAGTTAQNAIHVIPDIGSGVANSSSAYPWNRTTSSIRVQYVYGATELPGYAITIKRIRCRPLDSASTTQSWNGGAYNSVTVRMSTSASPSNALNTTFATNHGTDLTTVFNGSVKLLAGSGTGAGIPSKYYVDIVLSTPFTYDPAKGPLLIDFAVDGAQFVGSPAGTPYSTSTAVTSGDDASRLYNLTSHTATTGTFQAGIGLVCELTYDVNGTFPMFSADVRAGLPGLKVNFSDETVTSAPGGITAYAWDFDGDNRVDSTAQNPAFTYNTPGTYNVKLTVTSAHGSPSHTEQGFIVVADPIADLTYPDVLQFQFNELRGTQTANSASSNVAPAFATVSNPGWQGDPNRDLFDPNEAGFGMLAESGSASTNTVDTGWNLSITGSMTIMWWHRTGTTTSTNPFGYVFGGSGSSFRAFVGGAAGESVTFRGNAQIGTFDAGPDIFVSNTWIHLALVVDDTNGKATWYVDGQPANSTTFTPNTFTDSNSGFRVGWHTSTGSNYTEFHSMDDFRFYRQALSHAQVIAAMQAENAATSRYGTHCDSPAGTPLISSPSTPRMGNSSFSVDLSNAEPNRAMLLVLGLTAHVGGAFPVDVSAIFGTGCNLEAFPDVIVGGVTSNTGTFSYPLPVPVHPSLPGFHVYGQYMFQATTMGAMTQGLDINVQR